MTVTELIAELQKHDGDRVVIVQKDAEGNGFSPLDEVEGSNCAYVPETTWSGEWKLQELTDDLRAEGWSEDDVAEDGDAQPAIFLCPVN